MNNNENDFIKMCDDMENDLTTHYRKQRNNIRKLKKSYQKQMKKFSKKGKKNKNNGINKSTPIPNKIADLIEVERGTCMPRTKVGSLVYKIFNDRGLVYENDKRVLRVDDELREIFNVPLSVNDSINERDPVDVGINFFNLHSYIKRCYDD